MPITIDELNTLYSAEDPNWDFKLFPTWLVKKGIPATIISTVLKQVLINYSEDNLPEKHHDFDNQVLALAKEMKGKAEEYAIKALEADLSSTFQKYEEDWNSLSRMKKVWEVIRGRA